MAPAKGERAADRHEGDREVLVASGVGLLDGGDGDPGDARLERLLDVRQETRHALRCEAETIALHQGVDDLGKDLRVQLLGRVAMLDSAVDWHSARVAYEVLHHGDGPERVLSAEAHHARRRTNQQQRVRQTIAMVEADDGRAGPGHMLEPVHLRR